MLQRPVIVIEQNSQARMVIRRALENLVNHLDIIYFFKDIHTAIDEMKNFTESGMGVDLVVTDIFFNEDYNIFRLIRNMEEVPNLWNTPVVIYTNEADEEMYARIRKDIRHLPFQLVLKTYDESSLVEACKGLAEYRSENIHLLELESTIASYIKIGKPSLLAGAIRKIDITAQKYPKAFTGAKINFLKGNAHYGMWKSKTAALVPLFDTLEKFSESSGEFREAEAKVNTLTLEIEDLAKIAEKYLQASYQANPQHWQTINALYNLKMEQGKIKEAKTLLSELIELFPEQTDYHYKMGKMNELEGDFSGAIKHYLSASRNAIEEGIGGFDIQDVMEVVDDTIKATQMVLIKKGLTTLSSGHAKPGSEEYLSMKTLQKTNAMVRVAMAHVAKKTPNDPNLFNKIAITYRRVGNTRMAIEMYVRALKLDPKNHRIRINYAAALAVAESWNLALKEILKAKELDGEKEDEIAEDGLMEIIQQKNKKRLELFLL